MRWPLVTGIGLGIAAAAVLVKGYANSKSLELTRETVEISDLPPPFDGFRLLQLSDMHFRPHTRMVDRLLTLTDQVEPDLVCLTGDYALSRHALPDIDRFFQALVRRHTAIAIYGNRDYRVGLDRRTRARWATILPFLANGALCLERRKTHLWLAGVDDPHLGRDSLPAALATVPPDAPVILLAHSPEVILRELDPRIRLVLCGHTHGGQICLPGGKALYQNTAGLPAVFSSGRHRVGNAVLYISRGIGSTRLPLRFGCLPEATVFTLMRGTG